MFFKKLDTFVANTTAILMLLMMANVFVDVVLRYFFNIGIIASQEMEWHLFSAMFLLGISYSLSSESHVRVDFVYEKFSDKTKAIVNIFGTIFMLIAFSLLIIYSSYEFVMDSYTTNEISQDPGGLTHRWIIKAMIPLAFVLLVVTSIGYILKNINVLKAK